MKIISFYTAFSKLNEKCIKCESNLKLLPDIKGIERNARLNEVSTYVLVKTSDQKTHETAGNPN